MNVIHFVVMAVRISVWNQVSHGKSYEGEPGLTVPLPFPGHSQLPLAKVLKG